MDDLDIGIIIAQILNFAILLFVFKYFLGERIVKLIEERREKIKHIASAETKANETLEEAEKKASLILEDAKDRADKMKKESELLAKKSREKILADAEKDSQALLSSAKADIERDRQTMFEALKGKIVDISLKLNKKLFSDEIGAKDFMDKQVHSLKD